MTSACFLKMICGFLSSFNLLALQKFKAQRQTGTKAQRHKGTKFSGNMRKYEINLIYMINLQFCLFKISIGKDYQKLMLPPVENKYERAERQNDFYDYIILYMSVSIMCIYLYILATEFIMCLQCDFLLP